MGCEKRRYATGGREADSHDLGIEPLKCFELLSHLAEVSAAGDSGEVAQILRDEVAADLVRVSLAESTRHRPG